MYKLCPYLYYLTQRHPERERERERENDDDDELVHIKAKTPKGNDEGMKGALVQRIYRKMVGPRLSKN